MAKRDVYRYTVTETREVTVYAHDPVAAAKIAAVSLDKSKAERVSEPDTVSSTMKTTNLEIREGY